MGAEEMESVRRKVSIPAKDWVRLSVEFVADPDSGKLDPKIGLECRSCDSRLVWNETADWWECQICGMELTPVELVGFFKDCVELINGVIRSEDPITDDAESGVERNGQWTRERTAEILKNVKAEAVSIGGEALRQLLARFRSR